MGLSDPVFSQANDLGLQGPIELPGPRRLPGEDLAPAVPVQVRQAGRFGVRGRVACRRAEQAGVEQRSERRRADSSRRATKEVAACFDQFGFSKRMPGVVVSNPWGQFR